LLGLKDLIGGNDEAIRLYQMFKGPQSNPRQKEYSFMTIRPISPLSFSDISLFFQALKYPADFIKENLNKFHGPRSYGPFDFSLWYTRSSGNCFRTSYFRLNLLDYLSFYYFSFIFVALCSVPNLLLAPSDVPLPHQMLPLRSLEYHMPFANPPSPRGRYQETTQ
jgi:hypothetical protein